MAERRRSFIPFTKAFAKGSFRMETSGLDFRTTQKIEQAYFNTLDPYSKNKRKSMETKEIVVSDLISESSEELL